jgi:hypothetical protein
MANIEFVNWAHNHAALIAGEFPQEALFSYHVDYYLAQVNNGGHGQYAGNTSWTAVNVGACERGLRAMGADDYLAIFTEFRKFMDADAERAASVIAYCGFDHIEPEVRELDSRFFALNGADQLIAKNSTWLKTSPRLKPMTSQALDTAKEMITASNKLRAQRIAEAKQHRRKMNLQNPVFRMADKLCKSVGLEMQDFSGMPGTMALAVYGIKGEGTYGYRYPILTNKGEAALVFVEKYGILKMAAAVLSYQMAKKPLKSLPITNTEFNDIVPEEARDRMRSYKG